MGVLIIRQFDWHAFDQIYFSLTIGKTYKKLNIRHWTCLTSLIQRQPLNVIC